MKMSLKINEQTEEEILEITAMLSCGNLDI